MRRYAIAIVVLLAACESTPEAERRELCGRICECGTILPPVRRACVADCVDDPSSLPSPECADCLLTLTCDELFNGSHACDQACQGPIEDSSPAPAETP